MRLFAPKRESGMQKICISPRWPNAMARSAGATVVINFTPSWRIKHLPQANSRIMLGQGERET